ncbi:MAG TPA: condensation domain-containing protein, partial [Thermoanaerobaculia bacterium]|nr:condensation domain-containing protein [Thermoanaerobaculia bacterium]
MSDLDRRLAGISPERRALLKTMLESRRAKAPAAPELARRHDPAPAPLSFAQQRLWFLDQLEPGSAAYNIRRVLRLTGRVDVPALSAALHEIVRRHEVLRTIFEVRGREPVQVVHPEPGAAGILGRIDLAALPQEERERETRRVMAAEAEFPFDLSHGPLLRFRLLRLSADEHVLVGTMHHIVSDGWSMGVFVRELGEIYRAFSQRLPSSLPELPIQYSDYAAWQRRWLQGALLERELAYWRRQLGGLPPALDLPQDHPRLTVRRPRGARESVRLGARLSRTVEALGREEGATLFMTMLAGFTVLLARLSGQDDVSIGTPIAGRTRKETEGLIGFFVNTLVLRADLSGDPRFRELLGRVREMALEAQSHQEVPFERLVEELAPRRDMSRSPLFQVMFVLQNTAQELLELPGLRLERLDVETTTTKFDLTLALRQGAEGLSGSMEYDTSLFEAATMRRWLGHLETLLAAAVADPGRRISELPLLSEAERTQLLGEWCDTRSAYPLRRTIHDLFEEQAARAPDAVAVVFEGEWLTYRDLDLRATRLACRLGRLGVGPEVGVAICFERSLEMIVGIVAVLKAGGYYVPLDPKAPAQRLVFMIEDAGAPVVLADPELAATIPATSAEIVCLAGWEENGADREPLSRPHAGAGPNSLAYLMYTSGSTGQPKGVSVEHRAVVRLVRGNDFSRLDSTGVFLQLAPLAFDASTLEIWGPLLNGGSLVLMPPGPVSLEQLGRTLRQHQVTTLWLTAGLFHQMVDERLEDLSVLRELLAGGDVLSLPHVRTLLERTGSPV